MRKTYCDFCGDELTDLVPREYSIEIQPGSRLMSDYRPPLRITVVARTDFDDANLDPWDVCKHCVIGAVSKMDDRPTCGDKS